MSYYCEIYDSEHEFKKVYDGHLAELIFYYNKQSLPIDIPMAFGIVRGFGGEYHDPYNCTGLLSRELATKIQEYMTTNKTFFTDLMDEHHTDTLVFRIT